MIRTKRSYYIKRLMDERPTHTKGGIPIEIHEDGKFVITKSGRSRNGVSSVYVPHDYPQLFGWEKLQIKPKLKPKTIPPLVIKYKRFYYRRLRRHP